MVCIEELQINSSALLACQQHALSPKAWHGKLVPPLPSSFLWPDLNHEDWRRECCTALLIVHIHDERLLR